MDKTDKYWIDLKKFYSGDQVLSVEQLPVKFKILFHLQDNINDFNNLTKLWRYLDRTLNNLSNMKLGDDDMSDYESRRILESYSLTDLVSKMTEDRKAILIALMDNIEQKINEFDFFADIDNVALRR